MNNFSKNLVPGLEGGQKGRSYESKEEILGDDELEVTDPQKDYWVDVEDLSEEQSLGNFLSGFDLDKTVVEDIENEFENRDLSPKKIIKKIDKKQEKQEEVEYEELDTYTIDDFKLMEEVYKYKALADTMPGLKAHQPKFEDGKLLTDEQVNEQIEKYRDLKKNDKLKDYIKTAPEADKNLIRECFQFKFFYDYIAKSQKRPVRLDGEVITDAQQERLANEYVQFKNEKPDEFAKLRAEIKVENGEWKKGEFIWHDEDHKGKKQLVCSKKQDGIKTKYVVSHIPNGFKSNETKASFFYVDKKDKDEKIIKVKINENFFIIPIELKPPFTAPKKVAATEKVAEKEKVSQ